MNKLLLHPLDCKTTRHSLAAAGRYEDAKYLLQRDESLTSKQDLLTYAISTGDYSTANFLISDITVINDEINDWLNLNEFLISLYSNNKSVFEMNLDEYNYVRDLAYKCPISLASANAQSILHLVSGEEVPECITIGTRNAQQFVKEVEFASSGNEAYIEDNYPDPFTDKTYIDYYVPEGSTGSIFINDMYGRKLAEYTALEGENILTVEKGNLAPGIYTYGLIVNGQIIEFKKFVIKQ